MEEVVTQIEYIESTSDFDAQAKIKFFSDTRQSFGCSALVLQGGTALGTHKNLHSKLFSPHHFYL